MKRSILYLRGSLVPAILAAACALGFLLYHTATVEGRQERGDAHSESTTADRLVDRVACVAHGERSLSPGLVVFALHGRT